MTAFCDDFVTFLKAESTVTALVGTGTSARILQQDGLKQASTLPAITFRQIDEEIVDYFGGRTSLRGATLELTCYASTPTARNTLSNIVLAALDPTAGVQSFGTTTVTDIVTMSAGQDGDDVAVDGSDTRIYWKTSVFKIWYYAA